MTVEFPEVLEKSPEIGYPIIAIGYLTIAEPFDTTIESGPLPPDFVGKLKSLHHQGYILDSLGHHDCDLCLENPAISSSEKILTDHVNKVKYIFPDMIYHYISVHFYRPPEQFIEFIMKSQLPRIKMRGL